jgi:hypothetical protein
VTTTDTNILRAIVIKLQQRVQVKVATLLIKVKVLCGCPLNEEVDIRTERKKRTWSTPTNRTIYQW